MLSFGPEAIPGFSFKKCINKNIPPFRRTNNAESDKFSYHFFWLGLLILVASLFISKDTQASSVYWSSAYTFLNSIGIALITSYFFSYVISTNQFLKFIINILKKVVIERRFLSDLSQEEKFNVVREVIRASQEEEKVYSNIDSYYEFYIQNTLNVSSKNVRSDYTYVAHVVYDDTNERLMTHQMISYRLYPSNNGYEPIKVGFRDSNLNKCSFVRVYNRNGERKEFAEGELNFEEAEIGGQKVKMGKVELKAYNDIEPYLKVEIEITEEGFDHWIPIQFQALQPTDGLKFCIYIPEGYSVKRPETFGQGVKFHMDAPNSGREFVISCNQWLNEGAGLFVVVSKDSA